MNKAESSSFDTAGAARFLFGPSGSPRTLETWRLLGRGPRFRKVGRRVIYLRNDLLDFLDSCARSSTSDPGPPPRRARRSSRSAEARAQT